MIVSVKPDPHGRAAYYSQRFPDRPPLASTDEWLTGTWAIGACYRNPNSLYGAYPRGYLERVHSLFPEARSVLHAFSGGLTEEAAVDAWVSAVPAVADAWPPELVDCMGPEDGRHPTWRGDILDLPESWAGRFDLIFADPPYTAADAERYGTPMVNRREVIAALRRVARPGGNLVWLDTVWPMHRKDEWKCWGQIGLVRSTNHRVRLVSIFEAVGGAS